uniref:Geranylgeranyl transferase type-2 subunit alpha n=1 Tax=Cyprinus carpio TaxID=7962 RepID=A0A8C2DHC6_CYPCA
MHGRVKVKSTAQQEEEKRKEREKKLKAFVSARDAVLRKRSAGEHDEEALQLTQQLLSSNPDFATLWNYRREVLLQLETSREKDEVQKLYESELHFIEACLKVNPKSYGCWHHRSWVNTRLPQPDWTRELGLCDRCLSLDERNFHCWDYRRVVVKESGVSVEQELQFTDRLIGSNFSNYSSWHYRSTLLPQLHPQPIHSHRVCEEQLLKDQLLVCVCGRSELSVEKSSVLQAELQSCNQLLELEPQNKWCLLTIILLMRALDPLGHEKETLAHFQTLKEVDPMRSSYYSDLCSKFLIENTILKMEYAEVRVFSLSNKNLTTLCHLDQLLLVTHINLSSNQLLRLPPQFAMLQCLEVLEADDNAIESLEGLYHLPKLEEVSLRNNQICKLSDLESLASCTKLTRLDLRGNPVHKTANIDSELSQLLPLVTALSL